MKAVVAGATGLVGGHLIEGLLQRHDVQEIIILGRRSFPSDDPRIINMQSDLSDLSNLEFPDGFTWFCCLGTTIKKAGSKQHFIEVDRDMVLRFAEAASKHKAKSFHLVSAIGASQNSLFFYSRVKGEVEEKLTSIDLEATYIYQPSFILGDRKEYRFGEEVGKAVMKMMGPLMQGGLKKYRGIHAKDIALGMIRSAFKAKPGVHRFDSVEILKIT